jgi:amino-acid N-acetyltransferase
MSETVPFELRAAHADDLENVRRLLSQVALPLEGLEDQFGASYAVAEAGARLLGVAGIEVSGTHGLLRSVAVDPAARGQGAGDALVRNRIVWAEAEGLAALYLLTTTAADYFPRFGFAAIDRAQLPAAIQASREFASVCPTSATTMVRHTRAR